MNGGGPGDPADGGRRPSRPLEPVGDIPGSFAALYRQGGARSRLRVSLGDLADRHEYCEDFAQLLSETARHAHLDAGLPRQDVLERVGRGLLGPDSGVDGPEAAWVLCRLAEILGWEPPAGVSGTPGDDSYTVCRPDRPD